MNGRAESIHHVGSESNGCGGVQILGEGVIGDHMFQVLGNVVISKKILRTRRIMVMHSNERGECRPRTLVDS